MIFERAKTRVRKSVSLIQGHNKKVGMRFGHCGFDPYFVLDLADNFDSLLIGNRREYEFTNQPGSICHNHSDTLHKHPAMARVAMARVLLGCAKFEQPPFGSNLDLCGKMGMVLRKGLSSGR